MLLDVFVRIFGEVEQLGFLDSVSWRIILDQFPVAFSYRPHARFGASAIRTVQHVSYGCLFTLEYRFEADPLVCLRGINAGKIAHRGQDIEQIDISGHAGSGFDARPFDDHRDAPSVFVEVLLALQAMSANRHAMISRVEDVGVVEFTHRLKLVENSPDLDVDVFVARIFTPKFVADCSFVTICPDPADVDFITDRHVRIVKWVSR